MRYITQKDDMARMAMTSRWRTMENDGERMRGTVPNERAFQDRAMTRALFQSSS